MHFLKLFVEPKAKPLEPVCMSFSLSMDTYLHFQSKRFQFASGKICSTYSSMLRLSKAQRARAQNESIKQALLQDVYRVKVNPSA
jgi:hypothetical protein